MASFASRDLAAHHALVVDDTQDGRVIADAFEDEFRQLGGTITRRALNPGADPRTVLAPLAVELSPPTVVFFGGVSQTGAMLRRAMAEAGRASTPLLSWDALLDGSGADPGAYIQRVGVTAAVGSYIAHASLPDHKFSFADAYRGRYGTEPDEYSAAGYACVEILAAALTGAAARGPAATEVRELVRGLAVDPANRYETVLGTVGVDANGDALQQFVTFYRVEPIRGGRHGRLGDLQEVGLRTGAVIALSVVRLGPIGAVMVAHRAVQLVMDRASTLVNRIWPFDQSVSRRVAPVRRVPRPRSSA